MKRRTYVYIVCSPHRRTGVTTTARLLADYFAYNGRGFVGFDTDAHESPFADYFPRDAFVADLSVIQGQISLFDKLLVHDEVPKIVDVWSRSFKAFFSIVHEIGFFEEAWRHGIEPVIIYMADKTKAAADQATMLSQQWPRLMMVTAANEGAVPLGDGVFETLELYPTERSFQIATLDPVVARIMGEPDLSLSRFLLAPPTDMSIVVRSALRAWLARIFTQFHAFEMRLAMEDSDSLRG